MDTNGTTCGVSTLRSHMNLCYCRLSLLFVVSGKHRQAQDEVRMTWLTDPFLSAALGSEVDIEKELKSAQPFERLVVSRDWSNCWICGTLQTQAHWWWEVVVAFDIFLKVLTCKIYCQRYRGLLCGKHGDKPLRWNVKHSTHENADEWGMVYYCFTHSGSM